MDYMDLITKIFEIVLFPLLSAGTAYLINLLRIKSQEIKQKKDNELYHKYVDMLENTISNCVLATTQTYVDALKSQGKFDAEAQKSALEMTYNKVVAILSSEAYDYLTNVVGDLEAYIYNKIEADVISNK